MNFVLILLGNWYTDDPVITAESEDKLRRKLIRWKSEMEKMGLRVNTRKTKVMIIDPNLNSLKDS